MSTTQKFVKNTEKPPSNSPLWTYAVGWKVSQKTRIEYSPIDDIIFDDLGAAVMEQINLDIEKRDYISIEHENKDKTVRTLYFYPADFNGNGKFSIYAFYTEEEAQKKKAEVIRFAGYKKPESDGAQTSFGSTFKSTGNSITSSTAASQPTHTLSAHIPESYGYKPPTFQTITTFSEPQWVYADDIENIHVLQGEGFNFIPFSLSGLAPQVVPVYDEDGSVTGTRKELLMGKIINVKIPDTSSG